ncbi:hypothetical protein GCM10010387_36620 [Streptomyces inusitatus]|uniref:Uncharacterized protein n=1 Tax=Streptomyces inusitatus TaxID=68221 RepID=A0A918QCE2_9ACTN|nr:hypothetical protein [Streptomyces inusitatus]GGZ39194.1 hypothetical protein GCM10010387_36620 [Streptomyces inusitatus]
MAPRKSRSMTSATRHPTPYGVINLPHVPDRRAMQNLEGQLAKVIGVEAATTFAALPGRPERVRVQLDTGLYSYERIHIDERLMMIEVPSGFTAAVLPDWGNGRTAHDRVMAVGTVPPWPLPQATESAEAVLRMAGFDSGEGKPLTALEHAVEAVEASAKEVITGRVKSRRELAAVGVLRDIDVQATRICLLDGDGHTAGIRHDALRQLGSRQPEEEPLWLTPIPYGRSSGRPPPTTEHLCSNPPTSASSSPQETATPTSPQPSCPSRRPGCGSAATPGRTSPGARGMGRRRRERAGDPG